MERLTTTAPRRTATREPVPTRAVRRQPLRVRVGQTPKADRESRYFDYKVGLSGDHEAYVTYCSDESKSFIKDRKTGKVEETPTTAGSYVLYNAKLARNAEGVWQTTDIASNRGSDECRP
ncbi:hypothetical protein [Streptomyces coelicoflavus]|uniref:hypothetical protein n=1 Tax=Streptomyces coelicoflavus TaxID=285562 RepID=UPI00363DCE3E